MIPVSKPKITKQDIKKVLVSLKDGWVSSDGPDVTKFEEKFANFIGKKYCIAVSSGTAAFEIAVKSLNLKKNDEVIIPNFTIISNALAVIRQGAKPVFLDCSMHDWNIDYEELKKKNLGYGQNKRSSEHLNLYGDKPFDKEIHTKYLKHENINNLKGLEVELIYEWEVGSMLIFDRTHLHCSSSVIEGNKIGIATFTKK